MMKFSPQQTQFLLQRKGLTFGSPAAAQELARMALKADAQLKKPYKNQENHIKNNKNHIKTTNTI